MKRVHIKNFLSNTAIRMLMHPLVSLILTSLALFTFITTTTLEDTPDAFDPFILLYSAIMSLIVVITIVAKTRFHQFTALSAGLLGVFLGILTLFVELTLNQVIFDGYEHRQTALAVARSLLVVSTTWVLAGLFLEWWYENAMNRHRFIRILRRPLTMFRQHRNTD